ncbi:ROK family transcriptional regulator [Pseudochrobactrum sp. HB0163]|uniref:ROK family transcriptional regulator n=1 Tax=Pseudochrobactrum sp. HB0163 TaxID=3450708 RepID=UPI003F6DEBD8
MTEPRRIKAARGSNQEDTGVHNRRVVIDALHLNGQLSRADLARATGLSKQAVSNIVEELEQNGFVVSLEPEIRGRGQPSTPYRIVPDAAFTLGLQIDRHITRAIAVDLTGNILVREKALLDHDQGDGSPAEGLRVIFSLIENVRKKLSAQRPGAEERLLGMGVAMPGPFGLEHDKDDPLTMSAWHKYPLVNRLAAGTGLRVSIQNDAAACATAEAMVGAAHGLDHAVCLFLGYGIGAGLILNGALYRGFNGNAGEIGMVLAPPASAGERFSNIEHQASLASLYQALDLRAADPQVLEKVVAAVERDDVRFQQWLENAGCSLRWSVQMIETIFDPQTIILCGDMPEVLGRRLINAMQPLYPSNTERRVRFLPRLQLGMTDPWAVALGAAVEPINQAFDPRFSALQKTNPEQYQD